ncbi:CPP1-like family protein [Synechococcus elongatus IITB7]|uniref:CPP1-like family protein n=1 Tax=Synechococcus elongatus TaxID=32046 RepID=UPI0030CBFB7A
MADQTPYERLGVAESASFEEIQATRDRRLAELEPDSPQRTAIETAYDAILMERLRLRQEGKIKVPERIRFAEKPVTEPKKTPAFPTPTAPAWAGRLFDKPQPQELLTSSVVFGSLMVVALLPRLQPTMLQLLLVAGIGGSIWLVTRKENHFGRAALFSFIALLIGLLLGTAIAGLIPVLGPLSAEQIATAFALLLLWAIATFVH